MAHAVIPDSHLDLFKKKAFANLATLMPTVNLKLPRCGGLRRASCCNQYGRGAPEGQELKRDGRVALSIMDLTSVSLTWKCGAA